MSGESLPLFPLRTVLFPRMPLPLHIFEERYKRMIRRCVDEASAFGVVLIREGQEVGPPALPCSVGTRAQIHAVERLPEGRLNILAVGTERFRLLDYVADAEPYLLGVVESFHDAPADPALLAPLITEVTDLFHQFFHTLVAQAGVEMPEYELPDNAEELSFVIASVLQTPLEQRQTFLEMTDTQARLLEQRRLLKLELARLDSLTRMAARPAARLDASTLKRLYSRN